MIKLSFQASMLTVLAHGLLQVSVQVNRAAASVTSQGLGLPYGSPNLKRYVPEQERNPNAL